jgi:hypothetical protein
MQVGPSSLLEHYCVGWYIGSCVVGPYLLPSHLNGPAYCVSLQEVLLMLLEVVPLVVRHDVWFQHFGVPLYFSVQSQWHINIQFCDRWLGCGWRVSLACKIAGPQPSGLLPLENLKGIVYRDLPTDREDLTANFQAAMVTIDADIL